MATSNSNNDTPQQQSNTDTTPDSITNNTTSTATATAHHPHLPLRMTSVVVKGYGRGSTELGIPTANVDRDRGQFSTSSFDALPTGIYWGFCRIGQDDNNDDHAHHHIYKTACSIGYNPYYGNNRKTVEPHLIADPKDKRRHESSCGESLLGDFYDQPIRLSLVGYLRPELPFEGVEKLIEAIKQDIVNAEQLGEEENTSVAEEKTWVASDNPIV